jgi:signal transduction histidine kinase
VERGTDWFVGRAGNFLSNAVKFTPSGGKLDLDLQCEEVVESKSMEDHIVNSSPHGSTSEGSLLGAVGSQILSKTASQVKSGVGKVARLRLSVKDNGIGKQRSSSANLLQRPVGTDGDKFLGGMPA